jgi:hypothetical protein
MTEVLASIVGAILGVLLGLRLVCTWTDGMSGTSNESQR